MITIEWAFTYEALTLLTACHIRVGHPTETSHVWDKLGGLSINFKFFEQEDTGDSMSQVGNGWTNDRDQFVIMKTYFGGMTSQRYERKSSIKEF